MSGLSAALALPLLATLVQIRVLASPEMLVRLDWGRWIRICVLASPEMLVRLGLVL